MIDAHHHFWCYSPADYSWIGDEMANLRRDFLPADLKQEMDKVGVSGVISVQARQTVEETRALLRFADENDWIFGVVGWVPLATAHIESVLVEFARSPKLKGVRHVVQDEDVGFLDSADFNSAVERLRESGLVYDVLIFEHQLEEATHFIDRHPNQVFVLDHIAKPLIRDGELEPWRTRITELSRRDNVFCKLSGIATEANWTTWTPQTLEPYLETVLAAFGPSRLMFGSDWPVCRVATDYVQWLHIVRDWAAPLSDDEKLNLFENVARRVYHLNT